MGFVAKLASKKDEEKMAIIGVMFRQALLDTGFSSNTSIDNYPNFLYSLNTPSSSKRFLERIYDVYQRLNEEEKMFFKFEWLEAGRHYQFWYLSYCDFRGYKRRRKSAFKRISYLLFKEKV